MRFFRGLLQRLVVWAYTPTPEEREQQRADDLAKIKRLAADPPEWVLAAKEEDSFHD